MESGLYSVDFLSAPAEKLLFALLGKAFFVMAAYRSGFTYFFFVISFFENDSEISSI